MTDNRDAHTEQIAETLRTHGIYGFNGTQVACRCSHRNWRYLLDWHTHVAEALLPVVARIKADAAAEVAADIEAVAQTIANAAAEPVENFTANAWRQLLYMAAHDIRAALSAGRTALNTRLAQARAQGWQHCADYAERGKALTHDEGEALQKLNPYRAEASGEGQ